MSSLSCRSPLILFPPACLSLILLAAAGCSDIEDAIVSNMEPAATQQPTDPGQGGNLQDQPNAAQPNGGGFLDPAVPANPAAAGNPAAPQPAAPNAANEALSVHLSAGTSLPQTLPDGTGMGFTADYQFRTGQPNQSNKYLWVIVGHDGKSLSKEVKLTSRGTLPLLIVPGLRPEAGPFSSHIVEVTPDGSQRKISRSVDMR